MKQRLFFDVTQLIHWPGRLTGIPRVMQELAVRFDEDKDNECVFVTWVKDLGKFCEVNLSQTLAKRGQGIVYETIGDSTGATSGKALKKVAKTGLARLSRLSPNLTGVVEQRIRQNQAKGYKKVEFMPGDQLVIPWGEWADQTFISNLVQRHKQGLKIIQIVHDMGPIIAPQFANAGNAAITLPIYFGAILPISSLVLAISENTKKTITMWLKENKLPLPPIKVFREGDDFSFAKATKPTSEPFLKSGLNGDDFILMVGTLEPKKNHSLLYNVYKAAARNNIDLPKLVIVGQLGWRSDDIFGIMSEDPEVKDKFVWLLNTSDEELSWLYDHCLFTVFASFFEGWGIPVAESLSRGVPVIASNATSLAEVGGDFAEYFSPTSSDECMAKIVELLKPDKLAQARVKVKQYKPTSWDASFQQVKNYLKEIS